MHNVVKTNKTNSGFTLVELMVVIIIIGILAVMVYLSFGAWRDNTTTALIKNDLNNAAAAMQDYANFNGNYPSTIPSSFSVTKGVAVSLSETSDNTKTFCINGWSEPDTGIYYYYDSTAATVQKGGCRGSVIFKTELGANPNLVLDDSFSDTTTVWNSLDHWWVNIGDEVSYPLNTRVGDTGDPMINKPVLQISNSTARTLPWSVLQGPISYGDIVSGKTYEVSYYVRYRPSPSAVYNGYTVGLSARNSDGTNIAIPYPLNSDNITTTNAWHKVDFTVTATNNGSLGNLVYIYFDQKGFLTTGWTLEFQLVRVRLAS